MFKGSYVALATPFNQGKVDFPALKKLIEFQIDQGTNGLVPCGCTGEAATLSHEEHMAVVEFTVKTANKRVPVVAGTGSNSTAEAIKLTGYAQKIGADAALVITPYYNKPTQEGLYQHYKKIAEEVDLPLMVYNVPGRTGVNLLPTTMARLAGVKNIRAIKEASGSIQQISEVIELCGDQVDVLSGDDSISLSTVALGGKGVVSVTANIVPKEVAGLFTAFEKGNLKEAQRIHFYLRRLHESMFIETNPIPVKTALALMGMISDELRLPLTNMAEANRSKLKSILQEYKLVK